MIFGKDGRLLPRERARECSKTQFQRLDTWFDIEHLRCLQGLPTGVCADRHLARAHADIVERDGVAGASRRFGAVDQHYDLALEIPFHGEVYLARSQRLDRGLSVGGGLLSGLGAVFDAEGIVPIFCPS